MHGALGQSDEAIEALEEAKQGATIRPDARYHLGRLLYELKGDDELDRAIGELRAAIDANPKLTGAFYYLGRALRDQATRNLLNESMKALRQYLQAGAPLGHRSEVLRLMNTGIDVASISPSPGPSRSQQ